MPLYTVENTIKAIPPMNASVFLDGAEVKNCIEADTDAGYVIRAKLDASGHIFADGDEIATERLVGIVTVTTSPRA